MKWSTPGLDIFPQILECPTAFDWRLWCLYFLCPHCLHLPISVMCRCSPPHLLFWWFRCRRLWISYFLHVFNPPAIQTNSFYSLSTTSPYQNLTLERHWALVFFSTYDCKTSCCEASFAIWQPSFSLGISIFRRLTILSLPDNRCVFIAS